MLPHHAQPWASPKLTSKTLLPPPEGLRPFQHDPCPQDCQASWTAPLTGRSGPSLRHPAPWRGSSCSRRPTRTGSGSWSQRRNPGWVCAAAWRRRGVKRAAGWGEQRGTCRAQEAACKRLPQPNAAGSRTNAATRPEPPLPRVIPAGTDRGSRRLQRGARACTLGRARGTRQRGHTGTWAERAGLTPAPRGPGLQPGESPRGRHGGGGREASHTNDPRRGGNGPPHGQGHIPLTCRGPNCYQWGWARGYLRDTCGEVTWVERGTTAIG